MPPGPCRSADAVPRCPRRRVLTCSVDAVRRHAVRPPPLSASHLPHQLAREALVETDKKFDSQEYEAIWFRIFMSYNSSFLYISGQLSPLAATACQ
ncbi:unnamed protein product [Urochloa humidicola]